MRRLGLFRLHEGQEGVTAVIVALCLVGLVGMMVLVVDVGALLWKRREMVSGADAAALSAAKTCSVPTGKDPSDPKAQANTAATENVSGLTPSDLSDWQTSGCTQVFRTPRGYVTVTYSYAQRTFFAGIFGSSSKTVTTSATAAWGPLAGGKAVPIVLESSQFQGPCKVPDINPPASCNFWYNNGAAAIGDANWGFLSLDPSQWGVAPDDGNVCSNVGASTRADWIKHDSKDEVALQNPGPTYVCSVTGKADANWQDLLDRKNCLAGSTYSDGSTCPGNLLLMPVNDCDKQVDKNGNLVPCTSGTPDKFAIIGFTTLELDDVLKGNDPAAYGTPGTAAASGTCTNNVQLGLDAAGQRLLNNLASTCSGRTTIDSIPFNAAQSNNPAASLATTFKVYWKQGNNVTYYKGCDVGGIAPACDYTYNPATFALQWVNPANRNDGQTKLIDLQWNVNATPGTAGACGIRPPDANALCLVTKWLGYTDVNGTIGSGPTFGTQGHVLCDFNYNSCPAGVKP